MTKTLIDQISREFCYIICSTLPSYAFDNTKGITKALKQIDTEPSKLFLFLAEVAQYVYKIKPLPRREFPVKMTRTFSAVVAEPLVKYDIASMEIEDRLVIFWMSLVRLLLKFKSGYYNYDLTEAQLDNLETTARHIQQCALGYKVCSEKKVREFIDKLDV